jgi:hypothetical protein
MSYIADNILSLLQDEFTVDADGVKTVTVKQCGEIGTDLFLSRIPDTPDNVVTLTPVTPVYVLDSDFEYVFQLRVRNVDYDAGYKLIVDTFNRLVPHSFIILNEKRVMFKPSSPPAFVSFDDGGRALFTCYLNCITKKD